MYTSSFTPGASRRTEHGPIRENNTKCLFLQMKKGNYLKKRPSYQVYSPCPNTAVLGGEMAIERKHCGSEKKKSQCVHFLPCVELECKWCLVNEKNNVKNANQTSFR